MDFGPIIADGRAYTAGTRSLIEKNEFALRDVYPNRIQLFIPFFRVNHPTRPSIVRKNDSMTVDHRKNAFPQNRETVAPLGILKRE